jgi:hypothetical protein
MPDDLVIHVEPTPLIFTVGDVELTIGEPEQEPGAFAPPAGRRRRDRP